MTSDEELLTERTKLAFDQWPHLSAAYGCLNCDLIFREPVRVAVVSDTDGKCPKCGSESVFDVAAALDVQRPRSVSGGTTAAMELLTAHLDAALTEDR